MVNDTRLKTRKKTIEFINPVLYAHPEVMRDVVNGLNYGCGSEAFRAERGWDLVTGLGTPDFERLLDLGIA